VDSKRPMIVRRGLSIATGTFVDPAAQCQQIRREDVLSLPEREAPRDLGARPIGIAAHEVNAREALVCVLLNDAHVFSRDLARRLAAEQALERFPRPVVFVALLGQGRRRAVRAHAVDPDPSLVLAPDCEERSAEERCGVDALHRLSYLALSAP